MNFKPPISPQRKAFEAWFVASNTSACLRRGRKGYIDNTTRVAWRAWQHQGEKIGKVVNALWVATEHNALHHGDNHNTVIGGRQALEAVKL